MNIEKQLQKDGIIVKEKIDTDTILKITESISTKIEEEFPDLNVKKEEIFAKLSTLNMYKADMPESLAEANYCYKNSTIYFNSHIENEDIEEFAIHECLHYLQEVKSANKIRKMGQAEFNRFKTIGLGLNEAAVQYMAAKIIGIEPDYEKYYGVNIYTPSPSYYPMECALLNELIFFIGEDKLYKSTLFSTDYFKEEIIKNTKEEVYEKIIKAFDKILKYEEKIILLKNKMTNGENNKSQYTIEKYRDKIKELFLETQNLIIENFFGKEYDEITDLEKLENFRRKITKFKDIVGYAEEYEFFEDYYQETMNKLEHKANIFENEGNETALANISTFGFINKIKSILRLNKQKES